MRRMKTALLLLACAGTTQALANETSEYQLSPEQSFDSNQNWDSTEETEQMSGTRPSNHSESDDDRTSQMPGTMPQANDTDAPSSSASSSELSRGMIRDEKVGIKPQVGVFVFNQSNGETASRIAEGIQLDANIMSMISDDLDNVYFGPSSGAIFSHLGSPGSNVIGTDSDTSNAHPGHCEC